MARCMDCFGRGWVWRMVSLPPGRDGQVRFTIRKLSCPTCKAQGGAK